MVISSTRLRNRRIPVVVKCDVPGCDSTENSLGKSGKNAFLDYLRLSGWSIGIRCTCPKCHTKKHHDNFVECDSCHTRTYAKDIKAYASINYETFRKKIRNMGWHIQRGKTTCPKCARYVLKVMVGETELGSFDIRGITNIDMRLMVPGIEDPISTSSVIIGDRGGMFFVHAERG